MNNQLKVSLENIIPLTEARDHFSQIVAEVQKDKLYVLTKGGKPAVAIIDVKYLEAITGGEIQKQHIVEEIKKAPEKVGLPPMIEHPSPPPAQPPKPIPPPPPRPEPPPPKPEPPKPAGFAAPQPPLPKPPPPPSISPGVPPPAQPAKPSPPPPPPPPAKTPPPPEEKIEVQFYSEPQTDKDLKKPEDKQISPDDQNPPAQYAGKSDEPDDMSID